MTTVVISGNVIAADNKITALQTFEGEELKQQLEQVEQASLEVPNYHLIKDLVIESYTNPPETTTKIFDVSEMGFNIEGDNVLAVGAAGNGVTIQALELLEKGKDLKDQLTLLNGIMIDALKHFEPKMLEMLQSMLPSNFDTNTLPVSIDEYLKASAYSVAASAFAVVGEKYNYVIAPTNVEDKTLSLRKFSKDEMVAIGSGAITANLVYKSESLDLLEAAEDMIGTTLYYVDAKTSEDDLREFIRGVSVYDPMTGFESDLISF